MKRRKYMILLSFGWAMAFVSCGQDQKENLNYPQISLQTHNEVHYGQTVTDDYQNLDELENMDVRNWFKAQDSLAEVYFSSNALMNGFINRFEELQNVENGSISMISINETGNYFYLKYDDVAGVDKLHYRLQFSAPEKELFDPSSYKNGDLVINYIKPSYDGQKVVIGFNMGDQFSSHLVVYDVSEEKLLKGEFTNINPDFGGIEWLPDNSGFIYLYFPVVDNTKPGYKKNSFSVIHKIGEDPAELNFVFGNDATVDIAADFFPKVKIGSSQDNYIIGYSASSSDYYDSYIAKTTDVLKGDPKWVPFFKEKDKIYYNQGEVRNDQFIFRQGNDDGNRLSLVTIDNPDFNNPQVLAEGSKEMPITLFEVTKDNIYFAKSKYGVEVSILKIDKNKRTTTLAPPFSPGYVSFFGESVTHNNIGAEIDGWISDYSRYLINEDGVFDKEMLTNEINYPEFKNLVSEQVMVTSHDGEQVPLSLVYNKDLKFSANNEVFMYVYGAYGESLSPFFFPIFLDWAAQGGILAFPHVRGGGEKGKDWHVQGMKNLKYNSWKDLIACTESLIDRGLTKKGLISIYTSSAGGITAGMAVNERPDLYSSFIAEVPRMNPLGLESSSTSSSTSYLEYGTVNDSLEFLGLVKMDPYLNTKPATDYPAILIMPSANDDRIPLWDSGKYVAKLQKSNTAGTPVLMDIDYTSGHENSGYDESAILYSKIFSFARSNMKRD